VTWFNVDGACDYLAERGPKPSRKQVYALVGDGMQVARLGHTGRRLMFCAEWIDAYLTSKKSTKPQLVARGAA
jgi:hypothetical protein